MLAAKAAAPLPERRWPRQIDVENLPGSSHAITIQEGYLVESRLVADLQSRGQRVVWLRPEKHDLSPASLTRMVDLVQPAVPAGSGGSTVVIQLPVGTTRGLAGGPATGEEIVLASFLDGAAGEGAYGNLAIDRSDARAAAEHLGSSLPARALDRLVDIAGGRAAVIDSMLRAAVGPSAPEATAAIEHAHDVCSLIAATTARLLESADPARLDALALAARVGYAHDRLSALRPAVDAPEREPWWQPLVGGWQRLHYLWGRALLCLPAATTPRRDRFVRLVGELEAESAHVEAIELCLWMQAWDTAAEVLVDCLDLVLAEQNGTVRRWLSALPPKVLARHPALSRLRTALAPEQSPSSALLQDPWAALHESCDALIEMRFPGARAQAQRARRLSRQSREPAVGEYAKQIVRTTRQVRRTRVRVKQMDEFLRAVESAARIDAAACRNLPARSVQLPMPRVHGEGLQDPSAPRPAGALGRLNHPTVDVATSSGAPDLVAYLLGELRVVLDGQEVVSWSGMLGKSLLKFLMIQRPRPVTRDTLIDAFWPGVALASAKNRLHVALYSLRRDLRRVCAKPVVVHHRDAYAINPDLTVWLDIEEFTRLAAAGTALARAGNRDGAIRAEEAARALYRGDLIEDTPDLEWAAPERERLATTYMDLLAQLARLYFDDGRYPACVDICRRLLARDPCREQAHRLIMRSFMRLDQPHRAVAQFELCKRVLQSTLGMTPHRKTVALYESIRAHRAV